jgi:glycosyltransferase involved in cell wall biosynthesis
LAYLGRTDPGKGVEEAVEIFRALKDRPDIEARICGFQWRHSPQSKRLHEWLGQQDDITYVCNEWRQWSEDTDRWVADTLRNTDILVLPYKQLSTTMDVPLVLLEGMASLCAVVTKPYGDIPWVYGDSPFLLPEEGSAQTAVALIERARDLLPAERKRLDERNAELGSRSSAVVRRLGIGAAA